MRWLDVTLPMRVGHPAWPDDPPFLYEETMTMAAGGMANCARMSLSVHFGTHVDAPYHFVPNGATVDRIDPALLVGPCLVVDLRHVERLVEPGDLAGRVPQGTLRLLLKTRNGEFLHDTRFHTDYVSMSPAGARWLVDRGVRLLGMDYFSIGPYGQEAPTHVEFLGAGGVALENVDLAGIEPGRYDILCLPLKIEGSGGAPARVLLGLPQDTKG